MGLFGFGKKKEEVNEAPCCCEGASAPEAKAEPACACSGNAAEYTASEGCCGGSDCGIKSIKVLGPGCKSCHELNENARAAVKELGMDVEVDYITDMEKIMSYGVMSMPALVINEKVVSMGRALRTPDIIKLFKKLGYC